MSELTTPTPVDGADPIVDLSKAPLPTEKTLKMRGRLPSQFVRFMGFNTRILRMVAKGHN